MSVGFGVEVIHTVIQREPCVKRAVALGSGGEHSFHTFR